MILELCIVRHGESEGNRDRRFTGHGPSPLTPLGVRQADAVGEALRDLPPMMIYASDLPRAVQTAERIAQKTGATVTHRKDLRERDMGRYVGMRFDEVESMDPLGWAALVQRDLDFVPPEGESHRAVAMRVASALDALRGTHGHGRVVVVSHGVAINHMLRGLLGVSGDVSFQVDNCSIQHIELTPSGMVRVRRLNDVRHLAGLRADEAR